MSSLPETPSAVHEVDARPRRRQLYLLAGRLAAATLLLGASLLLSQQDRVNEQTRDGVMALIGGTFAMSLLAALELPRTKRLNVLAGAQLVWDLAVVTGLVYLFGGATSGFSFLYGVIVVAAALVVGPNATTITMAGAILAYATVSIGLANGWLPPPDEASHEIPVDELTLALLRNLVGLVLIGLLAGSLSERLRRTGGELRVAAQSAAGYARLNENILRSMASGLLTTDLAGRIQLMNPAGASMFGAEHPDDLTGREIASLLPIELDVRELDRGEGRATRVDGKRFPVGFSCSPLRDARGAVLGSLVVFQDLTELTQLRLKAERAERLAALGRLSAGLAHEIRNPLGSISGSVELVREAPELTAEDRRLLTLVLGEVDRLNDLVTTMLDVGRPRPPEPSDVDLGALAEEIARVTAADGRAPVHVQVASDRPVRVHADAAQLRQVLWNLVKNARQFSPAGGEVRVEVGYDSAGEPCVRVSDDGPGIAPEDRDHVFEMFFSKRKNGVGLGLALVRQIVDAHRGRISVDSVPGHGATFTVSLPRAVEEAVEGAPAG